jgi:hypothetical protein
VFFSVVVAIVFLELLRYSGYCYDLNMKCPPKSYVLGGWLPADGLLGSDWILRALTLLMD